MKIFKPENQRDRKPGEVAGIFVNLLADMDLSLQAPQDSVPVQHQVLIIEPGGVDQYHYHDSTWGIFTVQQGRVSVLINGREIPMEAGDVFVAEPPDRHRFANTGNQPVTITETRINPRADDRHLDT